ncbi:MAG TPA: multicopper oxidase domain-containing protein, partial [bacterium]
MKSLWMLRQDEEARCHLRCGLCPILLGVALAITGSALLLAARDFPTAIENPSGLPVLRAVLLPPPAVPPPITRKTPAIVELTLETTETRTRIADGVEHVLWTFNGTVPGPFIRVRVGDIVRVHYRNALGSQHLHSINFHAAGGDGGGGFVTQAAPGHEGEFEFTAFNPGL